jgi:uncharacterized protein (DUF4415 family)
MPFEWDEEKRESNRAKHRVDFVDIFGIVDGQVKEIVDKRRNYRETRIRRLGEIRGRVYVVVYTWREDNRRIRQMAENRGRIVRVTAKEARQMKGRTDYARLDAMTDEEIAQVVAEDPDAAPLDIDWTQARLVLPPGKESVTLRVDQDVLDWFRKQGKGYQTRMNAVLRAYKEAHQE